MSDEATATVLILWLLTQIDPFYLEVPIIPNELKRGDREAPNLRILLQSFTVVDVCDARPEPLHRLLHRRSAPAHLRKCFHTTVALSP